MTARMRVNETAQSSGLRMGLLLDRKKGRSSVSRLVVKTETQ